MKAFVCWVIILFFSVGAVETAGANEVLFVGDFDFTIGGKLAIPIIFGPSTDEYYDFAIAKEAVTDGAILNSPNPVFSISFTRGNKVYVCHKKYPECASVQIAKSDNRIEFLIDSKLVNPDTEEILESRDVLVIDGENYSKLGLE